jgi:hypothetical protein
MPAKTPLLKNAGPGTVGPWIKIGTGVPPITIRTSGGYTLGGVAGQKGVTIEISGDQGVLEPAMVPMGVVGGGSNPDTTTGNLSDLPDQSVCSIPYYPASYIRGRTGTGMGLGTGTGATVYMDFPR